MENQNPAEERARVHSPLLKLPSRIRRPHLCSVYACRTVGGTFGGNALGCAIATSVIDTIQEENLLQNAAERGSQLAQVNMSTPRMPAAGALLPHSVRC